MIGMNIRIENDTNIQIFVTLYSEYDFDTNEYANILV